MSRLSLLFVSLLALFAADCSRSKKESITFPAGEKATVGPLIYSVIDTQVLTQLPGDDPASVRTPQNRFYVVQLSVSNSGSSDMNIPGLTLVADSGQQYPELADGTNVPNWLGVLRKVGGAQTEQGTVVFDAPAQHYRLQLTDETDETQLSIDVPLNYVHEEMQLGATPERTAEPIKIPVK